MYNRPSNDNGRGRRPTLPSIRDLFSGESNNLNLLHLYLNLSTDELAMSTVSHDPHRVHSQVSDVEDRRNYPFGHELPMPIAHQVSFDSIAFDGITKTTAVSKTFGCESSSHEPT